MASDKIEAVPAWAENPLSEREMEVAERLATGASNAQIAQDLSVSPHTVKVHLRNIYAKLAVNSRTEASMLLLQQGWITVPGLEAIEDGAEEPPEILLVFPEPAPLSHLPAQVTFWQPAYLVAALILVVLAFGLPTLFAASPSTPNMLSDRQLTALGRPDVTDLPRWELLSPLPAARSRLGLAVIDTDLYVLGGESRSGQGVATVDIFDLKSNQWREGPPMPVAVANAGVTGLGGKIYVAGGSATVEMTEQIADEIQDELWVFDPASDAWSVAGPLPAPLAGAILTADEERLYLVGGWDGSQYRDEVWSRSVAQEEWTLVTRFTALGPRAFLGAVIANRQLYVMGGYNGRTEFADGAVFSLSQDAWQSLPSFSTPRSGLVLLHDGVSLLALGGGLTQFPQTHERFDASTNLWTNFPSPLPGEWRNLAAVYAGGRVHILGGWSGDYLDVHVQYQSRFDLFLPLNRSGS